MIENRTAGLLNAHIIHSRVVYHSFIVSTLKEQTIFAVFLSMLCRPVGLLLLIIGTLISNHHTCI